MGRRFRMKYVTVSADVDIDSVLSEMSEEDLIDEIVARRGNSWHGAVKDAIAQIQRGDLADAVTTLERDFFPKWASVGASHEQYALAVKAAVGEPAGEVG